MKYIVLASHKNESPYLQSCKEGVVEHDVDVQMCTLVSRKEHCAVLCYRDSKGGMKNIKKAIPVQIQRTLGMSTTSSHRPVVSSVPNPDHLLQSW